MKKFVVDNFGPIQHVDIEWGNLTFLVGAQASGKSLFLELLKLVVDKNHILNSLQRYNYILKKNADNVLNIYFGEGLSGLWKENTHILVDDNREFLKKHLLAPNNASATERLFYIPAQRILSISDGRPKNFMEFDAPTPYVLRNFSETLRLFMLGGLGGSTVIFPIKNRLKVALRSSFDETVFHGGTVYMDETSGQKKMKMSIDDMSIPFMAWSAGQKEFMPLLMGFYCLSGPPISVLKKENYRYIVIEEPEMGLHPLAIQSVLLQILELLRSGYQVIVSTHSRLFLEFAWTFNQLKYSEKEGRELALASMFNVTQKDNAWDIFNRVFEKKVATYFFSRKTGKVTSVDISSLDVCDPDVDMAEWGGLSEFSGKASDVVSRFYHEEE